MSSREEEISKTRDKLVSDIIYHAGGAPVWRTDTALDTVVWKLAEMQYEINQLKEGLNDKPQV